MKVWGRGQFIWPLWTSHHYAEVRIYSARDFSPEFFAGRVLFCPHCATGIHSVPVVWVVRFEKATQKLHQPQIPQPRANIPPHFLT